MRTPIINTPSTDSDNFQYSYVDEERACSHEGRSKEHSSYEAIEEVRQPEVYNMESKRSSRCNESNLGSHPDSNKIPILQDYFHYHNPVERSSHGAVPVEPQELNVSPDSSNTTQRGSPSGTSQRSFGLPVPIGSPNFPNISQKGSLSRTPQSSLPSVPSLRSASKDSDHSLNYFPKFDKASFRKPGIPPGLTIPDLSSLSLQDGASGYDISEEHLPTEAFFDPAFQSALKSAKGLAGSIDDQLARCAVAHSSNSDLHKIWAAAKKKRNFDFPVTRTIGIAGDSAAGILYYGTHGF